MLLPHGAIIAVADGEVLHLYRNTGAETHVKLAPLAAPAIAGDNKEAGKRHRSSAANPDRSRLAEDSFAAATADWLNREATEQRIDGLVVIAPPKTLGELRRHFGKGLKEKVLAEIGRELTNHSVADVEALIAHARPG